MPLPKRSPRKRSPRKRSPLKNFQGFEQEIVIQFIKLLNLVKVYHWKTYSYALHKATDKLYCDLQGHIDNFVEVLLGKIGNRVDLSKVNSITFKDMKSLKEFQKEIILTKKYLVDLDNNKVLNSMSNSDLYNIRDEILGDLNQFLYLSTFV